MALSQSELMRLLESLRRADGVEAIRVVCERILQELIEAEATEMIGAAPREHSETRTTWRNGHRERLLTTQAGDLDLKIPKVRSGSFLNRFQCGQGTGALAASGQVSRLG
ncbi:transposase [Streptomyces sp900105755]|uniref:Mutator family transposase n=1 Tax=Streptomyces sp. 900105755 TaxID=3154389 RepID=A0ABV1TR61_9ACTN